MNTQEWDEIRYNENNDKWEVILNGKVIYSSYSFFHIQDFLFPEIEE